jgi:hypothetical protein
MYAKKGPAAGGAQDKVHDNGNSKLSDRGKAASPAALELLASGSRGIDGNFKGLINYSR